MTNYVLPPASGPGIVTDGPFEFEIKTSFRGRTLDGYANWSLNGNNRIRLNLNMIWRDAQDLADMIEKHAIEVNGYTKERAARIRPFSEVLSFVRIFSEVVGHETMHLVFHQIAEVRHIRGRYGEADVHHYALQAIEDE